MTAMQSLVDLVYTPRTEWNDADVRHAFAETLSDRYAHVKDVTLKRNDERKFQLRVNTHTDKGAVPYVALIAPEQEESGQYGGMSFVMFPADEKGPALIGMVVGTNGLPPDEEVLGRHGHARKAAAIAAWLNSRLPSSAWTKRDPTRIDLDLPQVLAKDLELWKSSRERYGKVLYATFKPPVERTKAGDEIVGDALAAFIDLSMAERRINPKKPHDTHAEILRRQWLARVTPDVTQAGVADLLKTRRFVVIEGPPGTGKTRLATNLKAEVYGDRGTTVQFHPSTTYERFIGGLQPVQTGQLGFSFAPVAGTLMEAAQRAKQDPSHRHLLVIDEINRADLAKVLGEAIHLFEHTDVDRRITLAYDFPGYGRELSLPPNLDVLGTMNTADRSIAILDVAVRRRFAFVPLWPQLAVVEQHAGERMQQAFHDLLTLFVEYASDDALALMPGHYYFLAKDDEADRKLFTELRPLLEEYLAQGYVAGFADAMRAWLDLNVRAV